MTASEPQLPDFQIVRHVATGGFGDVYEAIDPAGRRCAIKIARTQFAQRRLWYEAVALRCVGAPTVPELYDSGRDDAGKQYAAMEWIAAETLDMRLKRLGRPLYLTEVEQIAPRMLMAVEKLHEAGFVHRDLKPEHIVLDEDDSGLLVRLLDLGLVVPIYTEEPMRVRRRNIILGTSAYMAPEQVDLATITTQTDIYALGVILYEILTGDVPFEGSSTEMQKSHVETKPPRVFDGTNIATPVQNVVARCMHKVADKRYASVTSLRIALQRALSKANR